MHSCKSCKNLARNHIPCKILQGSCFLETSYIDYISLDNSCKEYFFLRDLQRNILNARILQDPYKDCIYFQQLYTTNGFSVFFEYLFFRSLVIYWLKNLYLFHLRRTFSQPKKTSVYNVCFASAAITESKNYSVLL